MRASVIAAFGLTIAIGGCAGSSIQAAVRNSHLRVLAWTLGSQNAAAPTAPDAFLILIPKDKLAPKPPPSGPKPSNPETKPKATNAGSGVSTALSECLPATSFLPLSSDDHRILMAIHGSVFALDVGKPVPQPLENPDPNLHIARMLAWRSAPNGLEVLVTGRMRDGDELIYSLLIRGNQIVTSAPMEAVYDDPAAFFAAYKVPRCSEDGRTCLRISRDDDGAYIEAWSKETAESPTTLLQMAGAQDAAWDTKNQGAMLVLQNCP